MTASVVGLVVLVMALAVLLLGLHMNAAWPWQVKASAIVATMLTVAIGYFAGYGLLGWPTNRDLPEYAQWIAIDVNEPGKGKSRTGAVYLWAKPLDPINSPPRAYQLPYDRDLHDTVVAAMRRTQSGIQQGVRRNADFVAGMRGAGRGLPLNFFDIKPLKLPEKSSRRHERTDDKGG